MGRMCEALCHMLVVTAGFSVPILLGLVDKAKTENGPDHYAEKPVTFISKWYPGLPMPLNTIVNLGYVLVGFLWLYYTYQLDRQLRIKPPDAYCAYAFAWIGVIYGPIQLARILTQEHRWAIADQWATLPFFSWVGTWGLGVLYGWSWCRMVIITSISIASYFLTQFTEIGFEIALAFHILFAVAVGGILLKKYPSSDTIQTFILAISCCSGFVIVKLMDHELPEIHPIFTIISGHFLSKIADFMQIYYVAEFFYWVTQEKYYLQRSKKTS